MADLSGSQTERRQYFRIVDELGVAYRCLHSESDTELDNSNNPFTVIDNCDRRLLEIIGQLKLRDPLVAELADNLNLKLNSVIALLQERELLARRLKYQTRAVTISASGMAFLVEQDCSSWPYAEVALQLMPDNIHLYCVADIVECRPVSDNAFKLQLGFDRLAETDREILIQYVVRRQGDLLRAQRKQSLIDAGQRL